MASKTDPSAATPAAKKPRRRAAPAPVAEPATGGAKGLLRAGLKALNEVRDDVITRQGRVFEALLGLDTSKAPSGRSARDWRLLNPVQPDAAGMEKFEEIFDQRVARSLERLGMPSPQALAALVQQLEAINAHLARIETPAPRKRASTPRGK